MAEAVKIAGYTIEEDTVVPRAELPALVKGVKELGIQYGFHAVCYGHAGDGNLHIRIKKEGTENSQEDPEMIRGLRALFELVRSLGGTISGEHVIYFQHRIMQPLPLQQQVLVFSHGRAKLQKKAIGALNKLCFSAGQTVL